MAKGNPRRETGNRRKAAEQAAALGGSEGRGKGKSKKLRIDTTRSENEGLEILEKAKSISPVEKINQDIKDIENYLGYLQKEWDEGKDILGKEAVFSGYQTKIDQMEGQLMALGEEEAAAALESLKQIREQAAGIRKVIDELKKDNQATPEEGKPETPEQPVDIVKIEAGAAGKYDLFKDKRIEIGPGSAVKIGEVENCQVDIGAGTAIKVVKGVNSKFYVRAGASLMIENDFGCVVDSDPGAEVKIKNSHQKPEEKSPEPVSRAESGTAGELNAQEAKPAEKVPEAGAPEIKISEAWVQEIIDELKKYDLDRTEFEKKLSEIDRESDLKERIKRLTDFKNSFCEGRERQLAVWGEYNIKDLLVSGSTLKKSLGNLPEGLEPLHNFVYGSSRLTPPAAMNEIINKISGLQEEIEKQEAAAAEPTPEPAEPAPSAGPETIGLEAGDFKRGDQIFYIKKQDKGGYMMYSGTIESFRRGGMIRVKGQYKGEDKNYDVTANMPKFKDEGEAIKHRIGLSERAIKEKGLVESQTIILPAMEARPASEGKRERRAGPESEVIIVGVDLEKERLLVKRKNKQGEAIGNEFSVFAFTEGIKLAEAKSELPAPETPGQAKEGESHEKELASLLAELDQCESEYNSLAPADDRKSKLEGLYFRLKKGIDRINDLTEAGKISLSDDQSDKFREKGDLLVKISTEIKATGEVRPEAAEKDKIEEGKGKAENILESFTTSNVDTLTSKNRQDRIDQLFVQLVDIHKKYEVPRQWFLDNANIPPEVKDRLNKVWADQDRGPAAILQERAEKRKSQAEAGGQEAEEPTPEEKKEIKEIEEAEKEMTPEQKRNYLAGILGIGYLVRKYKSKAMAGALGAAGQTAAWAAGQKEKDSADRHWIARFLSSMSETYKTDEAKAQKGLDNLAEDLRNKKILSGVRHTTLSSLTAGGTALRLASLTLVPAKYVMLGAMGVARTVESAKETRLGGRKLKSKTERVSFGAEEVAWGEDKKQGVETYINGTGDWSSPKDQEKALENLERRLSLANQPLDESEREWIKVIAAYKEAKRERKTKDKTTGQELEVEKDELVDSSIADVYKRMYGEPAYENLTGMRHLYVRERVLDKNGKPLKRKVEFEDKDGRKTQQEEEVHEVHEISVNAGDEKIFENLERELKTLNDVILDIEGNDELSAAKKVAQKKGFIDRYQQHMKQYEWTPEAESGMFAKIWQKSRQFMEGSIHNKVKNDVEAVVNQIKEIEEDKKIDKKIKQAKKEAVLRKYKIKLNEYDRAVTQFGEVDSLAAGLKVGETLAKTVVLALTLRTLITGAAYAYENFFGHKGELKAISDLEERLRDMQDAKAAAIPPIGAGNMSPESLEGPPAPEGSGVAGPETASVTEGQITAATIHKGEGIEHALIRQLKENAEKFGFKGKPAELSHWAGVKAHQIAIETGYVDAKTGAEVRIGTAGIDKAAYVLTGDGKNPSIHEYLGGKPMEEHAAGAAFEGAPGEKTEEYEYLKGVAKAAKETAKKAAAAATEMAEKTVSPDGGSSVDNLPWEARGNYHYATATDFIEQHSQAFKDLSHHAASLGGERGPAESTLYEVIFEDKNHDNIPDAFILKNGSALLNFSETQTLTSTTDFNAYAHELGDQLARFGHNIDEVAAQLHNGLNREQAMHLINLAQAPDVGLSGFNFEQGIVPNSIFEAAIKALNNHGELFVIGHGKFDITQFRVFRDLSELKIGEGKIAEILSWTQKLDNNSWSMGQESALAKLLAEHKSNDSSAWIKTLFGEKLNIVDAKVDTTGSGVIFRHIGGPGGKLEFNFKTGEIKVGSNWARFAGNGETFKVNNLKGAIGWLNGKFKIPEDLPGDSGGEMAA